MNAQPMYVPTVAELQRLGPDRAGPFMDDCDDTTRMALDDAADPFTRARLQAHLNALAEARYAYMATLPLQARSREIERLEADAERLQAEADALKAVHRGKGGAA